MSSALNSSSSLNTAKIISLSIFLKNVVDSKINTLWIRNITETQSRVVRPKAPALLGSGSRNRKRPPRFQFLKGKRNTGLPCRERLRKPDEPAERWELKKGFIHYEEQWRGFGDHCPGLWTTCRELSGRQEVRRREHHPSQSTPSWLSSWSAGRPASAQSRSLNRALGKVSLMGLEGRNNFMYTV